MIKITLPDGSVREFDQNVVTPFEVAGDISKGLQKKSLAAKVEGKVVDMDFPIEKDSELSLLTFEDEDGEDTFRHSSSHIMAQAVKNLFPGTKIAIGPAIKDGFYYDFDSEHVFTPEDLEKIEKEMEKIVKEDNKFERKEMPRSEAIKLFQELGEDYKVELINDLPEDAKISIYTDGGFTDLCAGPHLPSTGHVKAFKLLNVAGAYWRGNSDNKMLQRIYGTSFPKKSDLENYLNLLEEAKKRDHRKLGQELGLFTLMDEGPGFPFFLPKGTKVKNLLLQYWREIHERENYVEIETPIILNKKLWETSGHWDHYRDNMYTLKIDEDDYAIKPMNCPGAFMVYRNDLHSYREFPIRLGEIGRVHRHELSGALHGLMRVRAFTQDDAHIFMLPEQIKDEIKNVVNKIDEIYEKFGFKYRIELSTRPEDSMGSDEDWENAEASLKKALEELGKPFTINEGDGAFYGPKIDFKLEDCLGRTWQCGTIQLDFQMPQRFDLTYVGKDNEKHRPITIHTVAFGSIERFIGILIEHFAGAFPVWLAPVQAKILTLTDKHNDYANKVYNELRKAGIRAEVDSRNEKIGFKIREAQLQKVPYMLIIGDKEVENDAVGLRKRGEGDLGALPLGEFKERVLKETQERSL